MTDRVLVEFSFPDHLNRAPVTLGSTLATVDSDIAELEAQFTLEHIQTYTTGARRFYRVTGVRGRRAAND